MVFMFECLFTVASAKAASARCWYLVGHPWQTPAHAEKGCKSFVSGESCVESFVTNATVRLLLAQNDKFTEEEMHNYRMAVTEREVGKMVK